MAYPGLAACSITESIDLEDLLKWRIEMQIQDGDDEVEVLVDISAT